MSDDLDGPISLENGLKIVDEVYVQNIIRYLKTKQLDKSHKNYIKCYSYYFTYLYCFVSMVLRLCDELDKAEDLNKYFKKTLIEHIEKTVIPELKKKKEDLLLKDFVKEWKDYTILVHYMRKMFNYLVSLDNRSFDFIFLPIILGSLLSKEL